jgi:divalent metal cation (Fe/Co/Zn/Cd) transporter
VGIARDTFLVLTDAESIRPETIAAAARGVPGVFGVHKVRSRGPRDAVSVDLHVQVDPALGIERGHAIGHAVKDRLAGHFPGVVDVVVHVEPSGGDEGPDIATRVRRVVASFPVEAHEITVHEGREVEVDLHLELAPDLSVAQAHALASQVEEAVRTTVAEVSRVVAHLEPRTGRHESVDTTIDAVDYADLLDRETARIPGLTNARDVGVARVEHGVRLSAHVSANADLPLKDAHELVERLEARLRTAAPELERVTIRLEPLVDESYHPCP